VSSSLKVSRGEDFSGHSQNCNDNERFIPYTYRTMAIDDPLKIEQQPGKAPGTTILRLTGPVTLRNLFDLQAKLRGGEMPAVTILDLTGVPYMDSAGMGTVINHHVRSQSKNVRLIVTGISPRVLELFKMTKVDGIITIYSTVEEAEAKI
jgi:anti-sigma B factor antagonist